MNTLTVTTAMTNTPYLTPSHYHVQSIEASPLTLTLSFTSTLDEHIYHAVITQIELSQACLKGEEILPKIFDGRCKMIIQNGVLRLVVVSNGQLISFEQICVRLSRKANNLKITCEEREEKSTKQVDNLSCQLSRLKNQFINDEAFIQYTSQKFIEHPKLSAYDKLIYNNSINNEIRWILLPQALQQYFSRKWSLSIHSLDWIAIGIANKLKLKDRNFSGLNGKSRHGCYVMDCWGWVHTALPSIYNYQQVGFKIQEGDTITIEVKPLQRLMQISKPGDIKLELPFEIDSMHEYYPALAVNKNAKISYEVRK